MSHESDSQSDQPQGHEQPTGEGLAQDLIQQVQHLRQQLEGTSQELAALRRQAELQRVLVQQRCIDLASALELADKAEKAGTPSPSPAAVVDQIRKQAPGLFRSSSSITAAISASVPLGRVSANGVLQQLRQKASQGDRASLLLYLQARRQHSGS
jgi:hypothetical protein